jgi:hypothetical protein
VEDQQGTLVLVLVPVLVIKIIIII